MANPKELLQQISNGQKTLNQAREELGLEPIEDERCMNKTIVAVRDTDACSEQVFTANFTFAQMQALGSRIDRARAIALTSLGISVAAVVLMLITH